MRLHRSSSLYNNALWGRPRPARGFNPACSPSLAKFGRIKSVLAALLFFAVPLLHPGLTSAATTCPPGAPVSDDFTASSLNTALWTVVAPAGGSVTVSNGEAMLAVPGGSNHDPASGGVDNSVRIMQQVANSDFDVAAKFNSAVATEYQGQGILVQQDSGTYIRFELYSDGYAHYLSAASVAGGKQTNQVSITVSNAGPPYWMQVQRTGNTWTLSGSTDGTHYTSAGSFTLAMTVAQIGPFAWNYNSTPANSPALTASIDYFYNLAASSASSSTCTLGAPVSDDFTASPLNTALWTSAAPAGGSVSVSNGHALLSVPGGSNHDAFVGGDNAVRIMQPVANADFDVAVKFDSPVTGQYDGQGILVQQDSGTYLRFEVYSMGGTANYAFASAVAAGNQTVHINTGVSNPGPSFWLQVQRSGNTWTLSTSTDGTHYTSAGSFTLAITVAQIGPYAWNYSVNPASAPALTSSIDYFYNLVTTASSGSGGSTPPATGSPAVSLSPSTVSFGSVNVGSSSASETVTLSSTGTADLTISSISITGTDSSDFAETNNCGTSLNTGSDCTITVTFKPEAAGTRSAELSIATNASSSPASVSLSGTGESVSTGGGGGAKNNVTYATGDHIYPSDIGYLNVVNPPSGVIYNCPAGHAYGDGIHDDTACIQAAIQRAYQACVVSNYYGCVEQTVYFPAGTYLVSGSFYQGQQPGNPASVTANVSSGCITGINVSNAGSGYFSYNSGLTGAYIYGGGGSLQNKTNGQGLNSSLLINSAGSITGLGVQGGGCLGQAFTSAPKIIPVIWRTGPRFEGQNKSNTIIKLAPHTFANGNCNVEETDPVAQQRCIAVFFFGNNEASDIMGGTGQNGFKNDIWNLTIEIAPGNPGASGIDWSASNRGSIGNVNVLFDDGQGGAGIITGRSNNIGAGMGPALIKNVSVKGGRYCLYNEGTSGQVSVTVNYLDCENQIVAGVITDNIPLQIEQMSATESGNVPAVFSNNYGNKSTAPLFLSNAAFSGNSTSTSAIEVQSTGTSYSTTFLRNVTTSGYRSALATGTTNQDWGEGATVTEWSNPAAIKIGTRTGGTTSLNLQAPNTPEYTDTNLSDWESVLIFPAQSGDWTQACNSAMSSGKPIVYFPDQQYTMSGTCHIPSTVKLVLGANSAIQRFSSNSNPIFSFEESAGNTVEMRNFSFCGGPNCSPSFAHNGTGTVVIANVFNPIGYSTGSGKGGTLFFEDAAMPGNIYPTGETIWCRQCDIEGGPDWQQTGGRLWILGYTTESGPCKNQSGTVISCNTILSISGASAAEVIGGYESNASWIGTGGNPMYTFINTPFSAESGAASWSGGWSPIIHDQNGSGSSSSNGYPSSGGTNWPLITDHN